MGSGPSASSELAGLNQRSHTTPSRLLTQSEGAVSQCRGMPGQLHFCPAGYPVHVIQRGVNRAVCFTSDQDMAAYAFNLKEGAQRYEVAVHAWVFMPNHIHLLVTPSSDDGVSRLMRHIGQRKQTRQTKGLDNRPRLPLAPYFDFFTVSIVKNLRTGIEYHTGTFF